MKIMQVPILGKPIDSLGDFSARGVEAVGTVEKVGIALLVGVQPLTEPLAQQIQRQHGDH